VTTATVDHTVAKFGGRPRLRVFIKGGTDVRDSLLPRGLGGTQLDFGLDDVVEEAFGGAYHVDTYHEPPAPAVALLKQLQAAMSNHRQDGAVDTTSILDIRPDVVVLSISSDLTADLDEFDRAMPEVIRLLKDAIGAHILVFNGSTLDPSAARTTNYHRAPDSPALAVYKLNLRLIQLSMLAGISIIDADRVAAEIGADGHIRGLVEYGPVLCRALCREVVRVLDDYGFFEERPLVPQLGRARQR